jgi:beta-RFAP synthase
LSSLNRRQDERGTRFAEVSSSARLHFGFLDVAGSLGRRFGSVGLSLSGPAIRLRARLSGSLSVHGSDGGDVESALRYARMFYERPEVGELLADSGGGCEIFLDETIPPHRGFGSGTQLALCVISALRRLHGLRRSPGEAAGIAGRGLRSGIGIEAFRSGGFIVDAGGDGVGGAAPLTLFRRDFPERWRAVLVLPPDARGLSGVDERSAFANMEATHVPAREICHIVLMKLLPALLEERLDAFGAALERMQQITGESFAEFQSGAFASPMAGDIFRRMRELGAVGMGQSSWGPLLYGFVDGEERASDVASGMRDFFAGMSSGRIEGEAPPVMVVSGRNRGAVIKAAPAAL